MENNENMNKKCELTDSELSAVAGGLTLNDLPFPDLDNMEELPCDYPQRSASWAPCERLEGTIYCCGFCKHFKYYRHGSTFDGYCTRTEETAWLDWTMINGR